MDERDHAVRKMRAASIVAGCLLFGMGILLWRFLPEIDAGIAARLRLPAGQAIVPWLAVATNMGGAAVMIPVALAAILYLAVTGRFHGATWAFLVIASGRIVVEGMKMLVDRARPPLDTHLVSVTSASFPSSHSAGTALTVLTLLAAFRAPRPAWVAGGLWIAFIGFSRVVLGVHWPSDVLAGWGLGLSWVAIFYADATFSAHGSLRTRD